MKDATFGVWLLQLYSHNMLGPVMNVSNPPQIILCEKLYTAQGSI